jgi:Zn-dependent protease
MPFFLRSWKVGRAFGIPLYVNPTLLLFPLLLLLLHNGQAGWGEALFLVLLTPALFGCVLLHELGHALMARAFGIGTRDITLYPIGGVARLERMPEAPGQELLVALAGPAVNVALAAFFIPAAVLLAWVLGIGPGELLAVESWQAAVCVFVVTLAGVNVSLVVFNMLPVFPMDGGRVFRALLAMWLGHLRATEVAAYIGLILAGGLALLAVLTFHPILFFLSLFLAFAGQAELAMLRRREALRRAAVPAVEAPPPEVAPPPPVAPEQPAAGHTGFIFDPQRRMWVWWRNGRPMADHRPQTE